LQRLRAASIRSLCHFCARCVVAAVRHLASLNGLGEPRSSTIPR
jgi:hypothetical protein